MPDTTENSAEPEMVVRSAGFLLSFGAFKLVDVGDLTWDKEMELACPINKLGTVTLLQRPTTVSTTIFREHLPRLGAEAAGSHGQQRSEEGSAIVGMEHDSENRRVGGVWQIASGIGFRQGSQHSGRHDCQLGSHADCKGNWIKASIPPNVSSGGTFTMTNGRNGFSKTYKIR